MGERVRRFGSTLHMDLSKVRAFNDRSRRNGLAAKARRPRTHLTQREARLQQVFHAQKQLHPWCANCGEETVFLQVHHAIPKEVLKRVLASKDGPCPLEVIWDPRNAMVVCSEPAPNRCHERHTVAYQRIGRVALSEENWAFAREHGLEYLLERDYPEHPE